MTNDPEDRLRTAQEPGNPAADLDERHMDKAASSTGTQVRAAAPLIGSTWRRPSRPGPPDAARADLDLDPDRCLPHHADDLACGQDRGVRAGVRGRDAVRADAPALLHDLGCAGLDERGLCGC
jgi:hypothetical protein